MFVRIFLVILLFSISVGIAISASCEINDYSKPGGEPFDIIANIKTWPECCNMCSENSPCAAFSFNKLGQDCRLFNQTDLVLNENNNIVSGILMPPDWFSTIATTTTPEPLNCPKNNTDPNIKFPHITDCEKYWTCFLGQLYLTSCFDQAIPFLFDYKEKQCRSPDIAQHIPGCLLPTIPPTTTTNSTTSIPISTTPIPTECPSTGTVDIPYPDDCTKYISCQDGYATVKQCNGGQYFDSVSKTCVPPGEANCFYPPTGGPTTLPPTIVTTVGPSTLSPGECPATGTIDIPYPGDCTKYINCQDGYTTVGQCPSGQWFDIDAKKCVPSAEANCPYSGSTTVLPPTTVTTSTSITTTAATTTSVPTTLISTTTAPTTLISTTTVSTTLATSTIVTTTAAGSSTLPPSTTELPPGECPATGIVDIPYPGDCSKYINCENGYVTVMQCLSGQWFDYKQKKCLSSSEAECIYA